MGFCWANMRRSLSRYGWFAFVAAFWIGLAAGQCSVRRVPLAVLLALALIAGLLVALERPFGAALVVILELPAASASDSIPP